MHLLSALSLLALGTPTSAFFGSSANLSSTSFCKTYDCSPAVLTRGESPAYIYTHTLNVPGVTAKLFRYPKQARPDTNQARTAPVLAASLDVWISSKTDVRAVAKIVRDLVKTVGGPDELPELYQGCLLNARRSDLPAGFEHVIVRTRLVFVKCVYVKPGAQLTFAVNPVLND
ncbi:hypothetical protein [Deinococcus yavapaiensis]|uniref:Uncharacterized protein n=1 Tax=Deinococcus yavapaiensis KR-236 TaxID=694435 RepID=A0A318STU5_9DEIO|nr:hypothetical protein [Deinococcus yavapaiensis]PYE56656.1 hypothetical protein DES52_101461 [Deinococcus yavapaiensis KR-236]